MPLHAGLAAWHRVCSGCGYEGSLLTPSINEAPAHGAIDEGLRDSGLRDLREHNFAMLLDRVTPLLPGPRLLEVGSAHGWFVHAASARGLDTLGIEPDEAVCAAALRSGLPLRPGYFPQALQPGERFDAIVFNDVFEHIPGAVETLAACAQRLDAGGLLVLNLPSSRGLFYRTAKAFRRAGVRGFFERLWQKGLPSPHVHYFHADNLARLGRPQGFEPIATFHLPSVRLRGLYHRIAYVRTPLRWMAPLVWAGVVAGWPLLALLPDIFVVVFRRAAVRPGGG